MTARTLAIAGALQNVRNLNFFSGASMGHDSTIMSVLDMHVQLRQAEREYSCKESAVKGEHG